MSEKLFKRLREKKIALYLAVGVFALLLLFALWKVFYPQSVSETATYTATDEEVKLSYLLTNLDDIDEANVFVTRSNEEITGVLVFYQGTDDILTKMNILNIVSSALDIAKSEIQVYSIG